MMHVSIAQADIAATAADRAPRLVERIKIETRWLLLSRPSDIEHSAADAEFVADVKADVVGGWPSIRHKRMPAAEIAAHFYDIVADQAASLAILIVARRNRTSRAS